MIFEFFDHCWLMSLFGPKPLILPQHKSKKATNCSSCHVSTTIDIATTNQPSNQLVWSWLRNEITLKVMKYWYQTFPRPFFSFTVFKELSSREIDSKTIAMIMNLRGDWKDALPIIPTIHAICSHLSNEPSRYHVLELVWAIFHGALIVALRLRWLKKAISYPTTCLRMPKVVYQPTNQPTNRQAWGPLAIFAWLLQNDDWKPNDSSGGTNRIGSE